MTKKLSAIDDFSAYAQKLETTDLPKIRKLLVKLHSSRSIHQEEVQRVRGELNDFCLWVKGILLSYLSAVIGQNPSLPRHLVEAFEVEIAHWDIIHKEVRKLDLTRPASRKYPRAYIQAVCAQIDRVLNRQELHLLVELLVDWKKQRLSA